MKSSFNPETIVSDFSKGKLNFTLAADLLISLLEKSNNPDMRRKSILALERLQGSNEKIFNTLENCILSDENHYVRSAAAKLVGHAYLKYGLKTLLWVIEHDKSPIVIRTIIDMVENETNNHSKPIEKAISKWIEVFSTHLDVVPKESRFFLDLEVSFAQDKYNYEITPLTYTYYKKIRRINDDDPWLLINNKHVEALKFNYFNWYFLKINQDIIDSFIEIKDLDTFLDLYKKIELKKFNSSTIPKSLVYLESLKTLKLKRNNLAKFPEFLTQIESLQELDLSYNSIREIPHSIMNLKNLRILKLNNNNIQKVSKGMKSYLSSLQIFDK
ncbi:MAG: leucine-rich repeat domain-containing protein [Candidatus Hodarchaeota archaeon]